MTDESRDLPATFLDDTASQVQAALTPVAQISVNEVFRDPVQSGDVVVIAAASISKGGGFGFGGGTDPRQASAGGGGGGGGGAEGRPVAIIEITPEGTRVKPVIDFTKVGLAALAGAIGLWHASRRGRKG